MSRIDIIITNYNRSTLVDKTIASVLNQTFRDFTLIVVDDGSTDNSLDVIYKATENDPRCMVIDIPHCGIPGNVKNSGASMGQSPYITFVDSDDTLLPTALEEVFKILDNTSVDVVYTDQVEVFPDQPDMLAPNATVPYSKENMLLINCMRQLCVMKQSLFSKMNGFDTNFKYAAHYDMNLKLSEIANVYHLQKPLYRRLKHPTHHSISSAFTDEQKQYIDLAKTNAKKRRGI